PPICLLSTTPPPPRPPLFPYTTLFRSCHFGQPPRRRVVEELADQAADSDISGAPQGEKRQVAVVVTAAQARLRQAIPDGRQRARDRKSTRLNSSHLVISYAVFCLKKKT